MTVNDLLTICLSSWATPPQALTWNRRQQQPSLFFNPLSEKPVHYDNRQDAMQPHASASTPTTRRSHKGKKVANTSVSSAFSPKKQNGTEITSSEVQQTTASFAPKQE